MEDPKQLNQLSKEDLKQLEDDMKIIKEHYLKELEREKSERDLQATRDSEQAELSAQKKVEEAEAKEIADKQKEETQVKQEKELADFRLSVIDSLNKISEKDNSETLTNLEDKLSTLVKTLENQEKKEEVSHFADLVILFFLLGCIPVYLCFKGLYKFFSDTVY